MYSRVKDEIKKLKLDVSVEDRILSAIDSISKPDEIVYRAISEVCKTDHPRIFSKMNESIYKVAKRAIELL